MAGAAAEPPGAVILLRSGVALPPVKYIRRADAAESETIILRIFLTVRHSPSLVACRLSPGRLVAWGICLAFSARLLLSNKETVQLSIYRIRPATPEWSACLPACLLGRLALFRLHNPNHHHNHHGLVLSSPRSPPLSELIPRFVIRQPDVRLYCSASRSASASVSSQLSSFVMPPIMAPEERARSVQALLAEKPSPRGFVAAVPTSPTPLSPFSPPALQPPPPSHYLRNSSRNSEGSDLFRKRSEIYTRVQRVLPPASHAEDSGSGLLFGSDFHADWSNTRLRRSPLSSPRFVAASPIHASPAHTPAAPLSALSAQSPSVTAYSKSNAYDTPSTRARDEDDTPEVSAPGSPSEAASKERPSRRPLRTLLRERLTVKVRSRSVEGASAAQPASSMDDPPRHSTELR